jgi:hypothetical protein
LKPQQKLEASRERLRSALAKARGSADKDDEGGQDEGDASFTDTLIRSAQRIWARHPLRGAVQVLRQVVGPALASELKPLVRSHPLRVLAIAVGLGAAVAWLRPWRLLPQAALGSALLSLALPRRALWQELLSSGLVERLVRGEWLASWFAGASPPASDAEAPHGTATPLEPAPTAAEPDVLHRMGPGTDAARAA